MSLPSGISIQLSGTYEDQQDSFGDLFTLMYLIVILVFIVMAAQFESLVDPFVIMFSIPFAFTGIVLVKNGIVLIDYISLNRERGMGIREAVVTGGHSRLRPVIMTTLTTILGMVPMAIGTGQGSEMWRPMGTAVIGGLTVSTILTLILIPVLYCVFASVGVKRKRKKHHERLLQDVKINSNN